VVIVSLDQFSGKFSSWRQSLFPIDVLLFVSFHGESSMLILNKGHSFENNGQELDFSAMGLAQGNDA